MEIGSVFISSVKRRIHIHMIILLQSVTIQFRRLFWHIFYYKVHQSSFITKCDRLLLQSLSGITKGAVTQFLTLEWLILFLFFKQLSNSWLVYWHLLWLWTYYTKQYICRSWNNWRFLNMCCWMSWYFFVTRSQEPLQKRSSYGFFNSCMLCFSYWYLPLFTFNTVSTVVMILKYRSRFIIK